LLVLS